MNAHPMPNTGSIHVSIGFVLALLSGDGSAQQQNNAGYLHLRGIVDVSTPTEDFKCLGVAAGQGHIYVSGWGKMPEGPHMIHQFALQLARREPGAEVRATARVSLNNRPAQLLIDPTVDLAREPLRYGLGHAPWIIELQVGYRP